MFRMGVGWGFRFRFRLVGSDRIGLVFRGWVVLGRVCVVVGLALFEE